MTSTASIKSATDHKVFVIGLPRTGTTSLCAALLDFGLKVAHTAYTQETFHLARLLADTPCFCDYPELDELFPGSQFVYLDRKLDGWIPSAQKLLKKMHLNLLPEGHFNPIIKRCFHETFALDGSGEPLTADNLKACYLRHQQQVDAYFADRDDLLRLDVSEPGSLTCLLNFIGQPTSQALDFPHLNADNKISAWRNLKHPNKVNSSASGHKRRRFFDYANK
jgi:hypothetical protein